MASGPEGADDLGELNGSGYQSVFLFIAGTWLVGAVVLAVFGPRSRPGTVERTAPEAKPVGV